MSKHISIDGQRKIEEIVQKSKNADEMIRYIGSILDKPKSKQEYYQKKKLNYTQITAEIFDLEPSAAIAEECVSTWIFSTAPIIHNIPQEFQLQSADSFEIHEDKNFVGFNGLFPDDPVLKALRSRLAILRSKQ